MNCLFVMVIILDVLIGCAEVGFSSSDSYKAKTTNYLQILSPGAHVCFDDGESDASWCSACSCAPDCDVEGDCCFSNHSTPHSSNIESSSTRSHSECLYPLSRPLTNRVELVLYNSYYMISSAPKNAARSIVPCGDREVAPWGSIYPVFSKSQRKIYKNRFCAEEYNATDWELWNAHIECSSSYFEQDYAMFITELYQGFIRDECHVRFEFDASFLILELCYKPADFVRLCKDIHIPENETVLDDDVNSDEQVSVLYPYFICPTVISNSCRICPGEALLECASKNFTDDDKSGLSPPFSSIIEPRYLYKSEENFPVKMVNVNTACVRQDTTNSRTGCRTVDCPVGQVLNGKGSCIYPGEIWKVGQIIVLINVTSNQPVSVSPLLESLGNLKMVIPKQWYIEAVAYEITNTDMETRNIAVFLGIQSKAPVKPAYIMKKLKLALNTPWLLVSRNKTVALDANLSRVKRVFEAGHREGLEINSGYKYIYHSGRTMRKRLHVTEMYLCEQVILHESEYLFYANNGTLLNLITNETLFEGEFTWNEDKLGQAPKVCLDKSGLQRIQTSNAYKIMFRKINCFILAFITKPLLSIIFNYM